VHHFLTPARRRAPLARDFPAELRVARTNGNIVTDSRGKKYLDFVMGWCVGNFRKVPPQRAARVDRRIDGAAAALADYRQALRRERTGHSGALDLTVAGFFN